MANKKLFGIYENKSLVETMSKTEIVEALTAIESQIDTQVNQKVAELEEQIQQDITPQLSAISSEVDGLSTDVTDFKILQEAEFASFKNEIEPDVAALQTGKENKIDADAVRTRVSALESGKLDKNASGSITMAMLSQEVRTSMTGGSVAVVGEGAVLTDNLTDDAVTPKKASFFKEVAVSGEVTNLFDGKYERYYLQGTNGAMTLASNSKGKCAVIEVDPNTSYSIAMNITTLLKVASSSTKVAVGGSFDGAINVNVGTTNGSVRVTGPNDKYLYVSVTNPSSDNYSDSDVFLKVVPATEKVLPEEGETYPTNENVKYLPDGVEIYSKEETNALVKKVDDKIDNVVNDLGYRKLRVIKSGTGLKIYVPCKKSSNWIEYYYYHYNSDTINMHQWRIYTVKVVDKDFKALVSFDDQCEWEGAIKEQGAADYMGGYHGDETNVELSLMIDDTVMSLSASSDNFDVYCESVHIVNQSTLNRCNTPGTNLFTRWKDEIWTRDGLIIRNKYKALQEVSLIESKIGLLSAKYTTTAGAEIVKTARKNDDYSLLDMSAAYSGFAGKDISQFELWGQTSEIYISIGFKTDKVYPNRQRYITDFRSQNRCKVYFDATGSYTMQAGEFLNGVSTIFINA